MISKLRALFKPVASPVLPKPNAEQLFHSCHAILHGTKGGFGITVGKSKVPNAGFGVTILEGTVRKGDVVALYSGHYYPPPPTWSLASPDGESALKLPAIVRSLPPGISADDPEAYQIHCNNVGGIIDGIQFTLTGSAETTPNLSPRTSAQLVNHPPRGIKPNVFSYSFSWADYLQFVTATLGAQEAEELKIITQVNPMGEGIWFYDPWTADAVPLHPGCAPLAGLACVASRDIQPGEELYMDYKYHPNNRPAWYVPVDYEEQEQQGRGRDRDRHTGGGDGASFGGLGAA